MTIETTPIPEATDESKETWAEYYRRSPARIKAFLIGAALLSVFVTCGSLFLSWKILTISEKQSSREVVRRTDAVDAKAESIPEYTFGYEMRDLSVPLKDQLGRQIGHAQFVVMFDCPSKDSRDQMPLHRARILDAINEAASYISITDVKEGTGMVTFKMHLKEILEMRLGKLAPRDLAVKNWFVG